ncbi:MAG: J domain-containing protein, partial [Myxococcota bacterium]
MDRRDLDEIERFLTSVGRPTLFAYYGLEPTADAAAVEDAIKKRRTWAQGQQSNPKYKSEALFLIKNNSLLKRVLLDHLDAYRDHVADDTQHRNLDVLTLFIRGTITSGQLTPQAEAAILHQGRQLELAEAAIARRITEILAETGAQRVGFESEDLSTEAMAIDHYAILGIATNAAPAAIEEAYRARYRWARNLKDLKRSAEVLQALDQAWRILSDPARRVRYDERRLQMLEVTDEVEKRAAALMGLLGGPEDAITGEAPLPGAPPSPVHEVGYRPATAPPGTRLPLGDPRAVATDPPASSGPNLAPPLPEPPPIRIAPRADGFAADRAPPPRAPAPPPVSGRTIGLAAGPQAVATLGPRLAVDGPDVVAVEVRGRPLARRWTVRNAGQGKMPGRVVSDREWLRVEQPRLDPVAPNQIVKVTVVPTQMPWGRTAGTVTFVTDHGERRT